MKQPVTLFILLACIQFVKAQPANFSQADLAVRQQLFSGDTALYNGEKINYISISKNGNIRLAGGGVDTLVFNLLLLHQFAFDTSTRFNEYGLHLNANILQLFVDGTREQVEWNEEGEVIVSATVLPVYEIKFGDAAGALATANALINLRPYCKPDKHSYRPGTKLR